MPSLARTSCGPITLLVILLAGCSAPRSVGAPARTVAPPLSPQQQYEQLLTKALPSTGLPGQATAPPLSRFVYADSGPDKLVGAVEATLTPGAGTNRSLTFEVYENARAARDRTFRGVASPVNPPDSTPLSVSKGVGWCFSVAIAGAEVTDEQCTVIVGNVVVSTSATSTGTPTAADPTGSFNPLDAQNAATVGLIHVLKVLPGL